MEQLMYGGRETAEAVNIHPVPLGGPLVTAGDLAVL
jgi:hypothetical protein